MNMKRDTNTHELVSLTVRLGCDGKRELQECAQKLQLTENTIARHAICAAINFIKETEYRVGPPFKMTLNVPGKQSPPASESESPS